MFFLLSGEGATDMGRCDHSVDQCETEGFDPGPMAIMVDQIVESKLCYSPLKTGVVGYVSERGLTTKARSMRRPKRSPALPGKKRKKETAYFFGNARALASLARDHAVKEKEDVVAVLFRDSDDKASDGRGNWRDKRKSMLDGFIYEEFFTGVAMIPKPKSEVWIICGMKATPYQNYKSLELEPGNDRSPKSVKKQLAELLGVRPTRDYLNDLVRGRKVDVDKIDMPSFNVFRDDLNTAIA